MITVEWYGPRGRTIFLDIARNRLRWVAANQSLRSIDHAHAPCTEWSRRLITPIHTQLDANRFDERIDLPFANQA